MIRRRRRRTKRLTRFAEAAARSGTPSPAETPEAGEPHAEDAPEVAHPAVSAPPDPTEEDAGWDWRGVSRHGAQSGSGTRRLRRHQRVWRAVRLMAWLTAALLPLALIAYDVRVTGRCEVPLLMEYARTRTVWHTTWAISLAVTAVMVAICLARASDPWPGRLALFAWAIWKGAVLLRDRVALPACAEGWGPETVRHSLELPLNVTAGLFYTIFVISLGLAARLRRKV